LIPTGDSTRAEYIMSKIGGLPEWRAKNKKELCHNNSLLVGGPGIAKTSVIFMYTMKFDSE
jgi:hypothetical protein